MVVFTDLDGTLLDATTYSFEEAREGLQALRERGVPLIICSSKTRAEIEYFRRLLENSHPFISENGGGIFIPKGYAGLEQLAVEAGAREEDEYYVIRLGAAYQELRQGIRSLRAEGFRVRGFGDMAAAEVAGLTGLPPEIAVMAKQRDFDEPFLLEDADRTDALFRAVDGMGLRVTQGRFMHLIGNSDKGRAVARLIEIVRQSWDELQTIAVGDAPNDLPMLGLVDYPIIVQRQDGSYHPRIHMPNLIRADGIGPAGWNRAVLSLLQMLDHQM